MISHSGRGPSIELSEYLDEISPVVESLSPAVLCCHCSNGDQKWILISNEIGIFSLLELGTISLTMHGYCQKLRNTISEAVNGIDTVQRLFATA